MNLIQTLEREAIEALTADRQVPEFRPGDTLRVGVKVIEGDRTRVQAFEGVCIARAKLYYLRGRTGKAARIAERRDVRRDVTGGQGAETEVTRAENAPEA